MHTEAIKGHLIPWDCSYKGLCATIRVLGTKPWSLARTGSALSKLLSHGTSPRLILRIYVFDDLYSNAILIWLLFWWMQDYINPRLAVQFLI